MSELKQKLKERLYKEWLSYKQYITQNFDKSNFISKAYEIFCIKEIAEYFSEYTELSAEAIQKLLQYDGNLLNYLYSEYMRADNVGLTSTLCREVDDAISELKEMKLY